MRSLSAGLETARTQTYARALLGFVVAVAAFGAGNFVHAQPGQESSPKSTARAADGGYRVVEFSRLLPRAPLPAGVESEPAAAPQILAVSFSAVAGPVRWYPPRRLIDVTVKFDRAVTVNTAAGIPRIDLVLGTRLLRHAGYASGSGSPELIFRYVTGDWNQALSDIAVGASSLRLNGGRIESLADAIAADLTHAAGRLDNVGARPDFAADNSFLVAASGTGAGANYVALPPAVLRTPLPGLNPDDGVARSRDGHGLVGGQWTVPPVSGDPGAALASVTVRAQLQGLEPLLDLSLFQPRVGDSPWAAPALGTLAAAEELRRDSELAQADVRQYRTTPTGDDGTGDTSNTLRAASSGLPSAPWLWAFVEGQTRIRLQWSRGNNTVIDHKIEVCSEADVLLDCDEEDDWTVLVANHPQPPSPQSNRYTETGLTADSTRHYRVRSRNENGHGPAAERSATTRDMVPVPEACSTALWSAEVTVARQFVFDKRGYMSPNFGSISDSKFSRGATDYMVTQLYFDQPSSYSEDNYGWTPDYHFAVDAAFPNDDLGDLTLHVGDVELPLSDVAAHSWQAYYQSYRWTGKHYKGTFEYEVGDRVPVCLVDSKPVVTLVLNPASIAEDGGVSTVTATVTQGLAEPFEVTVEAAAVFPAVAVDFTLSTNAVLSFAADAMGSSGMVTITAANNDVDAPHKTITVSGAVSEGARPDAPQPATLTIEDDDAAPVLSLTVAPAAIPEDAGVAEVVVSTGDTTFAVAQTITLTFAGSAAKNTDYQVSIEQLTFPASEHSVTATVTAEPDTVDEDDETILISATHAGVDVGTQQQITITDDDDEPELSITSDTVEEGESAEFEVTLDLASGRDVMVSYMTEDVTATAGDDYTALPSTTLTFTAGETAKTLTVTTADDTSHEPTETFSVTLSAATNATLEDGGSTLSGTGTIDDNDRLPRVSIADATAVIEGASAEFEVSLDVTSGNEVTVSYATGDTDDTAQPPGDYTAVAITTLTFAALDLVKTITVATKDDDLDEEDGETFTVTLSAPGNAELAADGTTATGTINDNDVGPKVSIGNATAVEGQAAEFEVSLDQASGKEVTVTYVTADGTAKQPGDYTALASTTLTFAGSDRVSTITVATEDDTLDEADETFEVRLSAPGNATLATDGTTGTGTITDNDNPPVLSLEDVTVTEGADVEFEVSLGAASELEVTVSYATADDTADEDDYTSASGTLTFEAGDLAKTITVMTEDDDLDEAASEQFKLTLSSAGNATLDGDQATLEKLGKIEDNDDPPVLSLADVTVTEGADVEFEVSLGAASELEVTVSYATADDTADEDDYTSASGTLTFEAGDLAKTITVTTEDDDLDEAASEQFKLTLSSAANATLFGGQATLQKLGKITDNDGAPVLSLEDVTVTEGADAEFEVSLGAASELEVTVSYATADDTADEDDYTSASGTLTFEAGDRAKTITVTTEDDDLDEAASEQFKLTLSSAGNATLDGDQATLEKLGKIEDNDDPPVLSLEDVTVTEGADVEFEVSLGAASELEVTVSYATADDTADEDDYTSASGTLTFEAGDRAKTITVTTEDDDLDEAASEQFKLTLSSAGNATLDGDQATLEKLGKIEDNDDPPVLSLEDVTVTEGADAEFEVSLGAASELEVTVSYATADDTADEDDYTSASGTLTFEAGDLAKTITVTTEDDDLDEAASEQFKLTLSSAANATLFGGQATLQKLGKIEDNDDPPVLSLEDVTVTEGADVEFEVSLGAASELEVTVSYATADDTADEDDYTSASGTLTFEAGDLAKTITVTTEDDDLDEAASEQFKLTLSSADNATLFGGQATLQKLGQDRRQRRPAGAVAGGRDGDRRCGRGVRGEPGSGERT